MNPASFKGLMARLTLNNLGLTDQDVNLLANAFQMKNGVGYLILDENEISAIGFSSLLKVFTNACTVDGLSLDGNNIGPGCAKDLHKFARNPLGDAAVKSLFEGLAMNEKPTIARLSLRQNDFTSSGFAALASGLNSNKSLKTLTLSDIPMDEESVDALVKALKAEDSTLEHLDLSRCQLGDTSAAKFLSLFTKEFTVNMIWEPQNTEVFCNKILACEISLWRIEDDKMSLEFFKKTAEALATMGRQKYEERTKAIDQAWDKHGKEQSIQKAATEVSGENVVDASVVTEVAEGDVAIEVPLTKKEMHAEIAVEPFSELDFNDCQVNIEQAAALFACIPDWSCPFIGLTKEPTSPISRHLTGLPDLYEAIKGHISIYSCRVGSDYGFEATSLLRDGSQPNTYYTDMDAHSLLLLTELWEYGKPQMETIAFAYNNINVKEEDVPDRLGRLLGKLPGLKTIEIQSDALIGALTTCIVNSDTITDIAIALSESTKPAKKKSGGAGANAKDSGSNKIEKKQSQPWMKPLCDALVRRGKELAKQAALKTAAVAAAAAAAQTEARNAETLEHEHNVTSEHERSPSESADQVNDEGAKEEEEESGDGIIEDHKLSRSRRTSMTVSSKPQSNGQIPQRLAVFKNPDLLILFRPKQLLQVKTGQELDIKISAIKRSVRKLLKEGRFRRALIRCPISMVFSGYPCILEATRRVCG
ncbi:hypothetical protein BJ741DRAFT_584548 [Chytriomyces cf. hyalinus JEL632]|nr:hypothetical protein BJ741DRAFT_584548 [Chytriomyces cf. hyalinus JEL632]